MEDTIIAVATSVGNSAINIIRISGSRSIEIVNNVFSRDLTKFLSNTINYGFIMDENEKIDEVLVSVFKSPKSYTTENMIEINTHGGVATTNKIVELLIQKGCRLAQPGEFIKRAFLNGRIDLIEAESVSNLINAKTESARKVSINGIDGKISALIKNLRNEILSLIANIEVNIDYPEYEDALIITNDLIKEKIKIIITKIKEILRKSEDHKIILNGINIGIIGMPNVGKSSLLNNLIGEEKAIVTDIEGTTRDIVEGHIVLSGIEIKLTDTAGIRKTKDIVEELGVKKSIEVKNNSDLILFVLDNGRKINVEEENLLKELNKDRVIILINKSDLITKINKQLLEGYNVLEISLKEKTGIERLKELIVEKFKISEIENSDFTYLTNARQIGLLKSCLNIAKEIEKANNLGTEVDLIEIDIKRLWETLGEIIGETYKEDLLNEIFSKFCLGK